ncbi:MAG: hypothetical protein IJX80_03435 [Clostridia bacterium]|nr:hypothetical protein [Clostridia bacterium]
MNAKAYFLRLDIVQKACRVLLIFFLLLLYFMRSWSLGVAGIVFLVGGLVISAIGSVLKIPHESKISEFVSVERHAFETEIKKENAAFRENDIAIFYAYDTHKEWLARTLGRRLIYPICLNMMFVSHGGGGTLMMGKLSLWEKKPQDKSRITFANMYVQTVRMDGDAEILHVTFLDGEDEKLNFYVRDDHYWKSFLSYVKGSITVEEISA